MESKEVVVEVDSLQSEGDVDVIGDDSLQSEGEVDLFVDDILQSEGEVDLFGDDSLQSEGEVDLIGVGYGGVIDEEKSKIFKCKFCDKIFDKYQALGGHMNKHPEDMNHLRIIQYEKSLKNKNSRLFQTLNSREHMLGTSSYPFNSFNELRDNSNTMSKMMPLEPSGFIQQPWQDMEPFQVWQGPMEPQQLSLPQATIYDSNLSEGPINCFPVMPNKPNLPPTYVTSEAAINGNFGLPSMDPSSSQNDPVAILDSPSSTAWDGYPGPCQCKSCIWLWFERQGRISPTLNWNPPSSLIPLHEQINISSYVQGAHGSCAYEVDTQEAGAAENIGEISNPAIAVEGTEELFEGLEELFEGLEEWFEGTEEWFEGTVEPFEGTEEPIEGIKD